MRNFLTGTQVRVAIVAIVPVDLELAVVPVRVRHIAVGVAGTPMYYLSPSDSPIALCKALCVQLVVLRA